MRARRAVIAVTAVLIGALPSGVALASPSPSPSAPLHAVPPKAPKPTDSAVSPEAPDPHPPRGGIGPLGEAVGGQRLLHRGVVLPEHAPPLPANITARSWIVVNLDTGAVVAGRDPHGRYQPASIQKLLTTVTLLPLLAGNRRVVVTRKAADTEGSHAGLVGGGHYTVDDLFKGLLLVSGNDAAEALADAAGGRAATVARMNIEARKLGAYDTYVQTPSGLDGWQQLTSAYDMALILRAALAQPRFAAYDRTARAFLPAQPGVLDRVELDNQNELFLTTVKGALVAKTGYTDAAQHTFVGAIRRHGVRYGVVLMRAQRWPDDQWVQATHLVDWAAALPDGTKPVGHLAGPDRLTPPSARTSAAAALARARARSAASSDGVPVPVLIAIGLLLVGGLALTGRRRRLR